MGKHVSSFEQKADWLAAHPEVWLGWPIRVGDWQIILALRKAGLISQGSHSYDIQDLGKLIGEARARIKSYKRKAIY